METAVDIQEMKTLEEINQGCEGLWQDGLKKCATRLIGDFYIARSEPCDSWWDWESSVSRLLMSELGSGSSFLDAGANFGYFTLLAAMEINEGHIYALEPNPFLFRVLQENVLIKGLGNVSLYNFALSDSDKELTFYWRNRANGDGRSYTPKDDGIRWNTYRVKAVTLDFFADRQVDVVKMDIEGAEIDVLPNSDKFFERNRVVKILLELHDRYIRERFGDEWLQIFYAFLRERFEVEVGRIGSGEHLYLTPK